MADVGLAGFIAVELALIFFFDVTATTEIYTLSLHDALPICSSRWRGVPPSPRDRISPSSSGRRDRKSTRLNSSHRTISYAVFCLKKKKTRTRYPPRSHEDSQVLTGQRYPEVCTRAHCPSARS